MYYHDENDISYSDPTSYLSNFDFSSNGGQMYYRYTTGATELANANRDAARLLAILEPANTNTTYNASLVVVVTFFRLTYFGGDYTTPVTTIIILTL